MDAKVGDFYRVEWAKGRFAFAAESDVKPTRGLRSGAVTEVWQREPPRIALVPDPLRGAPVADGDKYRLQGSAFAPASADPSARLRDVFVFVNDQKVFFKVVPESATTARLEFQTDVPLKVGNNIVTVFAREDDEFQTRRSVVIFRRSPAEVAQQAGSQPGARQAAQ
jgi:carboxyl-terminal processing protease